jgi:hypothetical protein
LRTCIFKQPFYRRLPRHNSLCIHCLPLYGRQKIMMIGNFCKTIEDRLRNVI